MLPYLLSPVDPHYPITQFFGENPSWYPNTNGHPGIDWGLPGGTIVRASYAGRVEKSERIDIGYGVHVVINHNNQAKTIYGHGTDLLVKAGENVIIGQPIMTSGNSGNSTGPHLHFEYRPGTGAIAQDPYGLLVETIPNEEILCWGKVVCSDSLLIRTGPSRERGILAEMKPGSKFQVFDFVYPGWCRMIYKNLQGFCRVGDDTERYVQFEPWHSGSDGNI